MKKTGLRIVAVFLLSLALGSCCKHKGDEKPHHYDQVVVMVGLGFNNLSSDITKNVNTLAANYLPEKKDGKALVVFAHTALSDWEFVKQTEPVLIQMYKKDGKVIRDTLKRYAADEVTASGKKLAEVFSDVCTLFPADHYGMLFSSHSTGWVPGGYKSEEESSGWTFSAMRKMMARPSSEPVAHENMPLFQGTKSIGIQCYLSASTQYTIELDEFVNAIPVHLDYMIFDSCLMGCSEVVYAFKDKADYMIASPCEILTDGFVYETLAADLLSGDTPDLRAVADDFYDYYKDDSGTIAYYDCSKIEPIAAAVHTICDAHRENVMNLKRNSVQGYNYSLDPFFFDIKDICVNLGATEAELATLQNALNACVLFKAATPAFLGRKIDPTKYSGMSMYLPNPNWPQLNEFYKSTSWNLAAGLLE